MKQSILKFATRFTTVLILLFSVVVAHAQDKIEVDTAEVKSWLEQNWIWVAAGVILLILIVALARGGRRTNTVRGTRRTTTVVKDPAGQTKTVTTTEEKL